METLEKEILVPADTSRLSELRAHLFRLCEESSIPSQTTRRMVLAIDEALANVIEHGLHDNDGKQPTVTVSLEMDEEKIVTIIRDHGKPFDPTNYEGNPDYRTYPKRGFGLYLIHLVVDDIEYRRGGSGENVLVLTKFIE